MLASIQLSDTTAASAMFRKKSSPFPRHRPSTLESTKLISSATAKTSGLLRSPTISVSFLGRVRYTGECGDCSSGYARLHFDWRTYGYLGSGKLQQRWIT